MSTEARARMSRMRVIQRLASRDASLFVDPVIAAERLGWIGAPQAALDEAPALRSFADEVVASGITDAVLLGMGGSSLAPLVLSRVFGSAAGHPALHVLDTTSPTQVSSLLSSLTPETTLVIVSSKSGTTIEPMSLAAIFQEWLRAALGGGAGAHMIALTDPGSALERLAQADGYARIISTPPDVGGRFAALTPFATLPAALMGIDVPALAASALRAETQCSTDDPDNRGAELAAWMADALSDGRTKLTLVISKEYAAFGLWVEQLVAESTGKRGQGLLPVLEDAPGDPSAHGADRMTFILRTPGDAALAALPSALPVEEPVFESVPRDADALGGEFVRWEWAVALLCALSAIEPFDQPNVAEAKDATEGILSGGGAPDAPATIEVRSTATGISGLEALAPALKVELDDAGAGSYLAVLAYLPDDEDLLAPLRDACATVSAARRLAVTLELGPRYLHSTGQYHKGGPARGVFVVLTAGSFDDVAVPGKPYTLGVLNRAQASGDVATLAAHGRPVIEVALPDPGLANVEAVALALRTLTVA